MRKRTLESTRNNELIEENTLLSRLNLEQAPAAFGIGYTQLYFTRECVHKSTDRYLDNLLQQSFQNYVKRTSIYSYDYY